VYHLYAIFLIVHGTQSHWCKGEAKRKLGRQGPPDSLGALPFDMMGAG